MTKVNIYHVQVSINSVPSQKNKMELYAKKSKMTIFAKKTPSWMFYCALMRLHNKTESYNQFSYRHLPIDTEAVFFSGKKF